MNANVKLIIAMLSLVILTAAATTPDSVKRRSRGFLITSRFNTLNMAPVSGNIVNRHVNADVSLVYTRKRFMFTFMNAVDLEDQRSDMNYFLCNVRYKINLTRRFSMTPFLAFYSEHAHQLFDVGSDANGGMLFMYQYKGFSVEAFALFVRLTHQNTQPDAINRVEIKYKWPAVSLSGFLYHNTAFFDEKQRLAIGFKATLPEFKLFDKVTMRTDVTGSFKISETPETKNLSGVFLSLVFPVSL